MDTAFISALIAFTLIVVSPGPAVLAIMATGIAEGRAQALALTTGVLSGSSIWGMVALFGFAAALEFIGQWLFVLKIIGGLYLLYLAQKALRSALANKAAEPMRLGRIKGLKGYYLTGLLIHLTNPKAVLGWAATITIGVPLGGGPAEALSLVAVCLVIVWSLKLAMALLFSTPLLMRAYQRAGRAIQFTFAGFFTLAAYKMISGR